MDLNPPPGGLRLWQVVAAYSISLVLTVLVSTFDERLHYASARHRNWYTHPEHGASLLPRPIAALRAVQDACSLRLNAGMRTAAAVPTAVC